MTNNADVEKLTLAVCLQSRVCMLHSQAELEENNCAISHMRFIYDYISDYIGSVMRGDISHAERNVVAIEERLHDIFQDKIARDNFMKLVRKDAKEFATTLL